jgi:hypothetical protein
LSCMDMLARSHRVKPLIFCGNVWYLYACLYDQYTGAQTGFVHACACMYTHSNGKAGYECGWWYRNKHTRAQIDAHMAPGDAHTRTRARAHTHTHTHTSKSPGVWHMMHAGKHRGNSIIQSNGPCMCKRMQNVNC